MIPADRFKLDGDTAWLIVDADHADRGDQWWSSVSFATDLDRPCETCGGNWTTRPYGGHLPDCPDCIDGRHTFDIEVECDGPIGANIASTDGTFRHLYRVSIVPGMILQIREWQGPIDPPLGRWLALNAVDGERYSIQECDGHGLTSHPSIHDLPAAKPGDWAVQLKVAA